MPISNRIRLGICALVGLLGMVQPIHLSAAEVLSLAERQELKAALIRLREAYNQSRLEGVLSQMTHGERLARQLRVEPGKVDRWDPASNQRIVIQPQEEVLMKQVTFAYQRQGTLRSFRQQTNLDLTADKQDPSRPLMKQAFEPANPPPETLECTGEKYRFRLKWTEPGGKPTLVELNGNDRSSDRGVLNAVESLLNAPFVSANLDFAELLADPKFVIEKREAIVDRGQPCLKYHFRYEKAFPATPQKKAFVGRLTGWFVTDPAHANAIRASAVLSDTGQSRGEVEVDYEGESEGIPLPKRISTKADGRILATVEFRRAALGEQPASDFTLAHFGLSEPAVDKPSEVDREATIAPWLLVVSGCFLAVAVYLGVRRWRSTQQVA